MIINTGMRTDIPAFYSKWLRNRVKEGFVLVRNPYDPQQVTKYLLMPDVVDIMAFCSKNPAPLVPYLRGVFACAEVRGGRPAGMQLPAGT